MFTMDHPKRGPIADRVGKAVFWEWTKGQLAISFQGNNSFDLVLQAEDVYELKQYLKRMEESEDKSGPTCSQRLTCTE
jgi:hypothetical protein